MLGLGCQLHPACVRAGALQGASVSVELLSVAPPLTAADARAQSLQLSKLTAASLLEHANLVTTHSLHISVQQPGAPAAGPVAARLVQEFCNGGSLQDALDDGMFRPPALPKPLPAMLAMLKGTAEAMAHAHAHGVAHGQLTGHDILLKVCTSSCTSCNEEMPSEDVQRYVPDSLTAHTQSVTARARHVHRPEIGL